MLNRMNAMNRILLPKSSETTDGKNMENKNEERLNGNFSTIEKEIVKLWEALEVLQNGNE
jgi:hypothetical protein